MPLLKGKSNVGRNIAELMATGKYPRRQAIAIALNVSRKRKYAAGDEHPHAPYIKAIMDHPETREPALVYADHLDESGLGGAAELVRRHHSPEEGLFFPHPNVTQYITPRYGAKGPGLYEPRVSLYTTFPRVDDPDKKWMVLLHHALPPRHVHDTPFLTHSAGVVDQDKAHELVTGMKGIFGVDAVREELEARYPWLRQRYSRRKYALMQPAQNADTVTVQVPVPQPAANSGHSANNQQSQPQLAPQQGQQPVPQQAQGSPIRLSRLPADLSVILPHDPPERSGAAPRRESRSAGESPAVPWVEPVDGVLPLNLWTGKRDYAAHGTPRFRPEVTSVEGMPFNGEPPEGAMSRDEAIDWWNKMRSGEVEPTTDVKLWHGDVHSGPAIGAYGIDRRPGGIRLSPNNNRFHPAFHTPTGGLRNTYFPLQDMMFYAKPDDPYRMWAMSVLHGNRYAIAPLVDTLRQRQHPLGNHPMWGQLFRAMQDKPPEHVFPYVHEILRHTAPEAFHRAAVENPADPAPGLVAADWLDERGNQYGELIRSELANLVPELRNSIKRRNAKRPYSRHHHTGIPNKHFTMPLWVSEQQKYGRGERKSVKQLVVAYMSRKRKYAAGEVTVHPDWLPTGVAPRLGHQLQQLHQAGGPEAAFAAAALENPADEPGPLGIWADWLEERGDETGRAAMFRHAPRAIAIDKALHAEISRHRIRGFMQPRDRRSGELMELSPGWVMQDWMQGVRSRVPKRTALALIRQTVPDANVHDLHHSILRLTDLNRKGLGRDYHNAAWEDVPQWPQSFPPPTDEDLRINSANLGRLGSPPANPHEYPDTRAIKKPRRR